jgi:hypothetical protein
MYPVTQEYNEKMKAGTRRIYGKVQIDYTDPFLDQSIEIQANEQANVSFPGQTADVVSEPFAKIASLDGSWVLGTYALAPATEEEAKTHQMGWWGKQLAGADGAFTIPYPTLTAAFFSRPIRSLKVMGDNARGEYPVDFTISLYDEAENLLHQETVTGNSQVAWDKALDPVITQVVKMVLVITKWSHPGRQVKILEFITSVQETYEGDDILLINFLEEKEVSQGSLPIGNISSNEIDIKLNNENRKFDVGNTQSSLYGLLKANRKIKVWIGVKQDGGTKELVPLGVFWSGDWKVPESDIYAQTTGRDRLELLRKSTYSTSYVQQNKTLYELAELVLLDAGLASEDYYIDPELSTYVIPYSWFGEQSHREALRKIAEACLGQVYCDREGIIRIEGPSHMENIISTSKGVFFLEGVFPAEVEGVIEAYGIGPDDYYLKDNPLNWSQIANYIEVDTQPLRPDILQEVYRSNDPISISAGQTKSMTMFYNSSPCINAVANLEDAPAGCTITGATYYAWGANIEVSSSATGTFTLVVDAQPMKILNKEKAIAQDENSIIDNGRLKYSFPANPLIQTLEMAQAIADKLLASFKDPRRDLELDWRGNPALLLNDLIVVPDYKDSRGYYYVTKNELEFDGTLRARLSGRRAL